MTTDKELSDLLLSGQFKVEQREGEDYSAALLRTALEECKRRIELEAELAALDAIRKELTTEISKWLAACDKAESSPDWGVYKTSEDTLARAREFD